MLVALVASALAWQSAGPCAVRGAASLRTNAPQASLLVRAGIAVPISTAALVALNIAQNGPAQPLSLDEIMDAPDVPLTYEGPPVIKSTGGVIHSQPFTPTDTAPDNLEDVLMLRTKADVVRAWRNGVAPALPGESGAEVYDGAVLRRGVLSPCSSFITHRLFGRGQRWRGKTFLGDGKGTNRFGGAAPNRFGVTRGDAKEIERVIREQVWQRKAQMDPLMLQLMEESGSSVLTPEEAEARLAELQQASAAAGAEAPEEVSCRSFTYAIEPSRLDGKPCLVLDYAAGGEGAGDTLWGRVLGMRDELREVVPGVLVGLGWLRATGGVANCAPFVMVRSAAS